MIGRHHRLSMLVAVAILVCACDRDSVRLSPTAPPVPPVAPPAPTYGGFVGPVTILGAGPTGDCVGDRLAEQAGSRFQLEVGLERAGDGSWVGTYYSSAFLNVAGTGCSARVVGAGGGYLDLDLYPYCDWSVSDWSFAASCVPPNSALVARRMRLPEPTGGAELAIRGMGTILIARHPETLPPLELQVEYDLVDSTPGS